MHKVVATMEEYLILTLYFYHENYQKILDRKTQLREKYRAFYQKLLDERRENLRKLGKADDTQDARNSDFLR